MRRNEKQITDQELLGDILSSNVICRVGFADGEYPYIVPMNYGYKENEIFLHSVLEGKKISLMQANNHVCVEITDSIEIVSSDRACGFSTKFRSVICNGRIHPVIELEQKIEGFKTIMKQHTGTLDWEIPESAVEKVAVLKIEIESMTGKISGI
ncbi:MAG: pyridoxamine 5'-phosphate oxidase family protein [Spirochaetaceae bacterium]|nr:pyridoxamine 5'-phosphate oxidase family protein [Spirochaetaceae bacterium]MCF7948161.1 pyridoxamine 5'-phosphate oxidase family protein [Spirochaetia bacterium]MCF7951035.1 pyridoxamine 5'-phosphate oxidase family protein [Spirochaetaceae bacterium]